MDGILLVAQLLQVFGTLIAGLGLIMSVLQLRASKRKRNRAVGSDYAERLRTLTQSLVVSSSQVDEVLSEIATVAKEKQQTNLALQEELQKLQQRENELRQRVDDLENVPIPVAEHFAALLEPGEKRSARRDWVLFFAGKAVGILSQAIPNLVGGG